MITFSVFIDIMLFFQFLNDSLVFLHKLVLKYEFYPYFSLKVPSVFVNKYITLYIDKFESQLFDSIMEKINIFLLELGYLYFSHSFFQLC